MREKENKESLEKKYANNEERSIGLGKKKGDDEGVRCEALAEAERFSGKGDKSSAMNMSCIYSWSR